MNSKIAGYYRLSMEDDNVKEESNSITNQRLLIKKYVATQSDLKQMEYCEFYDDGVSGTTMDRPGMNKLLRACRNNEISCVIVKDISRFSRDYIELGSYMEQIFPFMGIRFIAITDNYDSKDYVGKTADIDIGFKSLLSDFYCKDVSTKVKSSLSAKKNNGQYATGSTPFGYMKDEVDINKLVVVPEEKSIIQYIFELADQGNNLTSICKVLNDENIKTPLEFKNIRKKQNRKELKQEHKYWQPGTVRAILTNENYIGNMVHGKSKRAEVGSKKKILIPRNEWKIYENHHEPIIDADMYWRVQKAYTKEKVINRKSMDLPLRGVMVCAYCGRNMKIVKNGPAKKSIYCPNHKLNSSNQCLSEFLDYDSFETMVLNTIMKQMPEVADMNMFCQETRKKASLDEKAIEDQIKDISILICDAKEEKLIKLQQYHEGKITKVAFMEQKKELDRFISELDKEIKDKTKKLTDLIEQSKGNKVDTSELLKFEGSTKLTSKMVDSFIDKIVIHEDKQIDIFWRFNGDICSQGL